jgi:hypothetical protein
LVILLLSLAFCHTTSKGVALNIEEYVPVAIPMRRARTKVLILSPPSNIEPKEPRTSEMK